MSFLERLDRNKIPKHVAIIMDGNGRWAERHGKARVFGHEHGVESVRSVVEGAGEIGINHLTLYAFSTENWDRPKNEPVDRPNHPIYHRIIFLADTPFLFQVFFPVYT